MGARFPFSLLACLLLLTVGCGFCSSPTEGNESTVPGQCQLVTPVVEAPKLDILFVIDNSGSMREEQEGVARELTAFLDEVRRGGGVHQDFRVGVITTAVYQNVVLGSLKSYREYPNQAGRLQPVPDRSADGGVVLGTGSERLLSGLDPELADKFARLVQVGTLGSGQETPFEAVRLALMSDLASLPLEQGGNGGFLRDRARLLVVLVTDEDDCSEKDRPVKAWVGNDSSRDYCTEQTLSLTPVEEYHRLFSQELLDATGAHREIIWATIGPVGRSTKQVQAILDNGQVRNIDCPTSYQPGFRQRRMAELFDPSLENLDSICRDSYRETLVKIAGLANVSQTLEVRNVPHESVLQITLVRLDGSTTLCTMHNGGLVSYDKPTADRPGRVHFGNQCLRRADDQEVRIRLLCAG